MKNFIIAGGDERFFYIKNELLKHGYNVNWLYADKHFSHVEEEIHITDSSVFILPLPLTKNGKYLYTPLSDKKITLIEVEKLTQGHTVFTSNEKIKGINYFSDEYVTLKNARLTAVGLLKEILLYENEDIINKKALVTGFGRVSKEVCEIMKNNGIDVSVFVRSPVQLKEAEKRGFKSFYLSDAKEKISEFDYIINTVPAAVFDDDTIKTAKKDSAFFELAKELPAETCKAVSAYIDCGGMPGKHLPKSSGKVISDFILNFSRE